MIALDPKLEELCLEELKSVAAQKEAAIRQIEEITKEKRRKPGNLLVRWSFEVFGAPEGRGGDSFAEQLSRMYERYAERKGWEWKKNLRVLSDLGGYKASFEINGTGVYEALRYEMGCIGFKEFPRRKNRGECILLPPRWRFCHSMLA